MNTANLNDLYEDPATPYWLRAAMDAVDVDRHDPVDIANGLEAWLNAFKADLGTFRA